jgi:hypothetical protein
MILVDDDKTLRNLNDELEKKGDFTSTTMANTSTGDYSNIIQAYIRRQSLEVTKEEPFGEISETEINKETINSHKAKKRFKKGHTLESTPQKSPQKKCSSPHLSKHQHKERNQPMHMKRVHPPPIVISGLPEVVEIQSQHYSTNPNLLYNTNTHQHHQQDHQHHQHHQHSAIEAFTLNSNPHIHNTCSSAKNLHSLSPISNLPVNFHSNFNFPPSHTLLPPRQLTQQRLLLNLHPGFNFNKGIRAKSQKPFHYDHVSAVCNQHLSPLHTLPQKGISCEDDRNRSKSWNRFAKLPNPVNPSLSPLHIPHQQYAMRNPTHFPFNAHGISCNYNSNSNSTSSLSQTRAFTPQTLAKSPRKRFMRGNIKEECNELMEYLHSIKNIEAKYDAMFNELKLEEGSDLKFITGKMLKLDEGSHQILTRMNSVKDEYKRIKQLLVDQRLLEQEEALERYRNLFKEKTSNFSEQSREELGLSTDNTLHFNHNLFSPENKPQFSPLKNN